MSMLRLATRSVWLLLCLIVSQWAAAQPETGALDQLKEQGESSLSVELDKTSVGIAERVRYTLIVQTTGMLTVDFQGVGEQLGSFEVIERHPAGPVSLPDGRVQWQREYLLGPIRAGPATIPALQVTFLSARGACLSASDCELSAHGRRSARGSRAREQFQLTTDPVTIEVSTVLPDDADTTRPRDVLKPLALAAPGGGSGIAHWQWQMAAGVGALFIAMLGWLGYRRASLSPDGPGNSGADAKQLALDRLNTLRRAALPEQGKTSELLFQLSQILRRYLSDEFSMPALHMTTDELEQLRLNTRPAAGVTHEVVSFLKSLDRSRFAHHYPNNEQCRALIDQAAAIVQSISGAPPR